MSAREILDQYARKKGLKLKASIENYIRREHLADARTFWKERYNYLKHSDRDADTVTDFTNVQIHNENETFLNGQKYNQLFGETTGHMHGFNMYMMARYPHWFDIDAYNLPKANKDYLLGLNKKSRKELCELFTEVTKQSTGALRETIATHRLSFADAVVVREAEKDSDGKYFVRK